uniref:Uncharacterized protein n=1 Tax=Anguilla anguilla TaxID=7936 RepID=A0A0E9SW03_ANGAN
MAGLPPLNTNVPCRSRHLHLAKSLQQPNRVLRYHKQWYVPPSQLYLENYFH